jgi:hypothetical protein
MCSSGVNRRCCRGLLLQFLRLLEVQHVRLAQPHTPSASPTSPKL